MINIERIDHVVMTTLDIDRTCAFYSKVLGIETTTFGEGRRSLAFGAHKLNLHEFGKEPAPRAAQPKPGSLDICLTTSTKLSDVVAHLRSCEVPIIEGPVKRTGALGQLTSVYIRDPDLNLIEVSSYVWEPFGYSQG